MELRTVGLNGKTKSHEVTSFLGKTFGDVTPEDKNTVLDDMIEGKKDKNRRDKIFRNCRPHNDARLLSAGSQQSCVYGVRSEGVPFSGR